MELPITPYEADLLRGSKLRASDIQLINRYIQLSLEGIDLDYIDRLNFISLCTRHTEDIERMYQGVGWDIDREQVKEGILLIFSHHPPLGSLVISLE